MWTSTISRTASGARPAPASSRSSGLRRRDAHAFPARHAERARRPAQRASEQGPFRWHARRIVAAAEVDVMAICGVITTKEVLRHTATIVREFGPTAYMRCCFAILRGRRTTFLNCVFAV